MDRPWLTAGALLRAVLLITLLYVQTAGHEFTVCDDNVYIYKNPMGSPSGLNFGANQRNGHWAFADAHEGNWHPLTWMSHMLDWQMLGTWEPENKRYVDSWPGGHHLVSMGIHCANAVLLFLALRLMTGTLWPSFVVAALFAVHPLRVESVAWAAERKDVLCGLFWMASMLAYAFYARRRPFGESSPPEVAGTLGIYLLVTVLFGMALLAKSMAVTLPCVFLLLDAWPLDRWRKALWPPGQPARPARIYRRRWAAGREDSLVWHGRLRLLADRGRAGQGRGAEFVGRAAVGPASAECHDEHRQLSRPDVLAGGNGPILSPSAHAEQRLAAGPPPTIARRPSAR